MSYEIKRVEYFNVTVDDHAGDGAKMLIVFAEAGVSWHAFKAEPVDSNRTRFTLFPDDSSKMLTGAESAGIVLYGPYPAIKIKGDEVPGALSVIYEKLSASNIVLSESIGIADINHGYGVVLCLAQADCEKAMKVLEK
jgi:hypothetical protein